MLLSSCFLDRTRRCSRSKPVAPTIANHQTSPSYLGVDWDCFRISMWLFERNKHRSSTSCSFSFRYYGDEFGWSIWKSRVDSGGTFACRCSGEGEFVSPWTWLEVNGADEKIRGRGWSFVFSFSPLNLPKDAQEAAKKANFDLQGHQIKAAQPEQTRAPRLVRIGAIQNAIQKPTTASVVEQVCTESFSSHFRNIFTFNLL